MSITRSRIGNLQQKKGGHWDPSSSKQPLPIVIESLCGFSPRADAWPCYSGIFTGHSILVPNKDDARALYSMGCFGKPHTNLFNGEQPVILRERQFDRRQKWADFFTEREAKRESSESEEELEEPDISELRVPKKEEEPSNPFKTADVPMNNKSNSADSNDDIIVEKVFRVKERREWFSSCSSWGQQKESDPSQNGSAPSPKLIEIDEITILSDSEEAPKDNVQSVDTNGNVESIEDDDDIEIITPADLTSKPKDSVSQDDPMTKANDPLPSTVEEQASEDEEMRLQVSDDEDGDKVEMTSVADSNKLQIDTSLEEEIIDSVLVISDTDCSGSKDALFKHWNPKIKQQTFNNCDESIALGLEEGFFLLWALNCFQIYASKSILCEHENSSRQSPQPGPSGLQINEVLIDLDPTFAWNLFAKVQPNFPVRYAVYHHLRSKGWVVKSGSKFGGDFVIYKDGPSRYHASSIVVVESEFKDFTWQDLLSLNRVAESTSKEVLICRVSWPSEYLTENLSWLSKVYIEDRVLKRHTLKGSAKEGDSEERFSDSSDL